MGVARCTVERLIRLLGLRGVIRSKVVRTLISDSSTPCPLDKVNRQFRAAQPNQLCDSDFSNDSTGENLTVCSRGVEIGGHQFSIQFG